MAWIGIHQPVISILYLLFINFEKEVFKLFFEEIGPIVSADIATSSTGESKGYGFVVFAEEKSVELALNKIHILDQRQVYIYYLYFNIIS